MNAFTLSTTVATLVAVGLGTSATKKNGPKEPGQGRDGVVMSILDSDGQLGGTLAKSKAFILPVGVHDENLSRQEREKKHEIEGGKKTIKGGKEKEG